MLGQPYVEFDSVEVSLTRLRKNDAVKNQKQGDQDACGDSQSTPKGGGY